MQEKVVVVDRGNLEFLYPAAWTLSGNKDGYLTLSDPTESCRLEVSYQKLPSKAAAEMPMDRLLKKLLDQVPEAPADVPLTCQSDPGRELWWADYAYPSTDKRSGNEAEAHGRWLIGANGLFQVLMTFYYWVDDQTWAVKAWERIVETIQFGDGTTLESPEEHWSMRKKH